MIKNINEYLIKPSTPQHYSPIRTSHKNVSPIRKSPIRQHYCETQRAGNLSPIRRRNDANSRSRSPNNKTPFREKNSKNGPLSLRQKQEITVMEKTIKKGVGLFQQLANKKKLSSNKKADQRMMVQTTNPPQPSDLQFTNFSELSERKKESSPSKDESSMNVEKKCNFQTLLKNIKEIQSVSGSQNQKKKYQTQKEKQKDKTEPKKQIRSRQYDLGFIDSFATPKQSQLIFPEQNTINNLEETNLIEEKKENPQNASKEVQDSYGDILSLLSKASQPVTEKKYELEESVKISMQSGSQNYFNMNPFMM